MRQLRIEPIVSRIKQLPPLTPKLRVSLVWALLPALLLVWFVYGIIGGIADFQGWGVLHLFVWIWLALPLRC